MTRTGLRMDQAAMIYEALTSARRVSVRVGPAGAGKTHTAWSAGRTTLLGDACHAMLPFPPGRRNSLHAKICW